MSRVFVMLMGVLVLALGSGCELRKKMYDQPKYEAYEASEIFPDGTSARPLVEGTVARGFLREDDHFYRGMVNGQFATELPMPVTMELVERGQERYDIFCSVCHDPSGYGLGMIVTRGFKQPESYHSDRLRGAPVGYYYQVISEGYGMMPSYAYQIKPEDRWAIVAYIRALQLSQYTPVAEVPEDLRAQWTATP
jgi:mono/diheme cytochrome c family protein